MAADVLFINPPDEKSKYKKYLNIRIPPLGILYIAAVLEEHGISIEVMDCAAEDTTFADIERRVAATEPFIVGITATTPLLEEAVKAAEAAKRGGAKTVVLGGPHATFMHQEILSGTDAVDIIIKGEGEYTFLELYQALRAESDLQTVSGLVFRSGGEITETDDRPYHLDLDGLPYPARHLIPKENYRIFDVNMPIATLICSRGCPMACSFCASSALHGKVIRKRSPQNVISEMKHIRETLGIPMFAFMDDTFTLVPGWVETFCRLLIEEDMDIEWGCTARADRIDANLIGLMKQAGCETLFIGVESGNQDILDRIRKGTRVDDIRAIFRAARMYGMRTIASVAIGLPGETKETVKKSIAFVKQLQASYALFSVATPYPGTEFYAAMKERGALPQNWTRFDLFQPIVETMNLTIDEIRDLQAGAYREFYLRPIYILKTLAKEGRPFFHAMRMLVSP
ncbi:MULTISPECIES: B12-binding domain-containing radical SAM protein [Methanocalculus]|uniref:B12-binding domain-containing radical SAM protein n=1 Tax=Methanocalculus TaxID=71151 RepID=UPI00209D0104|nr:MULTISPECIES: radical SAM protein [unclassified Methanocalculus]MCP1662274.1 radical SAM superfamily enzyme YgiQ (UPF0313 family) [Methanocalculus sp. AMF5]